MKSCRVLVLNYNGKELLERFLPSVLESARQSTVPCRVSVVDNPGGERIDGFLRSHFPEVGHFPCKVNKVLCSFNEAARHYSEDVLIFLNNDIQTDPGFLDPLMKVFDDHADAFFAATYGDRSIAKRRWGILSADIYYPGFEHAILKPGFAFSAGVGAFSREKFLELGGYDEMYLPGYYEDVDLCFRGWKRGWKGYYVPESRQFHIGGASFTKTFDRNDTQAMVFRNSVLFMIKNVSDPRLLVPFWIGLPFRLASSALTGKFFIWRGFFQAIGRLPQSWRSRKEAKKHFRVNDCEILRTVNEDVAPRRSVRLMRAMVDMLGKHRWLRPFFFWPGFFTIRLLFPVEYLLLRELMDCESILDLGCGRHSMVPILPSYIYKVGVELYEPHYREAVEKGRHNRTIQADVRTVKFEEKSFDAVVMLDVLEHLTKEEGAALMEKMRRWAKKKVVIFTPNGFLPQHEYDDNPLMEHQSGWEASEFKKQGFRVYGVRAFKSWVAPFFRHDDEKPHPAARLLDVFQLVTYHWPTKAFQLFCVRTVN